MYKSPLLLGFAALIAGASAEAQVSRVSEADFTATSGIITFSEFALGTTNPTYLPLIYGAL